MFDQEKANLFIPQHMHGGLKRYIEQGIIPGSFLTAVLENKLKEAVSFADEINKRALPSYVTFLYNYAPSGCWGSPEKVSAWVSRHEKARTSSDNGAKS